MDTYHVKLNPYRIVEIPFCLGYRLFWKGEWFSHANLYEVMYHIENGEPMKHRAGQIYAGFDEYWLK